MRGRPASGFTYLSLMILLAIIGLVSAASIKLGAIAARSAAERELLAIGEEYADALQSYAKATPSGMSPLPPSFKELLHDTRFPGMRRHLRKIYVDPMTGTAEWGLVYANGANSGATLGAASGAASGANPNAAGGVNPPLAGGARPSPQGIAAAARASAAQSGGANGIVAIYSLSEAKAIKVGNFPPRFQAFEGRLRLSDWKFARAEGATAPLQQPPGAPQAGDGMAPPNLPGTPPVDAPSEPTLAPPQPQAVEPRRGDVRGEGRSDEPREPQEPAPEPAAEPTRDPGAEPMDEPARR